MSAVSRGGEPGSQKWLVLVYHIRPKPDYFRVKVVRQIRSIGAVAIKNSVYLLPDSPEARLAATRLTREIRRSGGRAMVCEAHFIEGLSDESARDLFRDVQDREYSAIASKARELAAALQRREGRTEPGRRRIRTKLARLQRRFQNTVAGDRFGGRSMDTAAGVLSLVEDRLEGVEKPGRSPAPDRPPRAATWVTRRGVMVDRIASSWLIRRFIDREARFKFVGARNYRPARGEVRFDMAEAEFTHERNLCTFEVLLERFRLRDAALRPIADIVHDLDLNDGKHNRPEAVGVDRLITGLSIKMTSDQVRLEQGAALFDSLYESFRRQGR